MRIIGEKVKRTRATTPGVHKDEPAPYDKAQDECQGRVRNESFCGHGETPHDTGLLIAKGGDQRRLAEQ